MWVLLYVSISYGIQPYSVSYCPSSSSTKHPQHRTVSYSVNCVSHKTHIVRPKSNGARMFSTEPGNRITNIYTCTPSPFGCGVWVCGMSHFNAQHFARCLMRLWCARLGDIFMRVVGLVGISITSDNNFVIHLSNSSSSSAMAAAA